MSSQTTMTNVYLDPLQENDFKIGKALKTVIMLIMPEYDFFSCFLDNITRGASCEKVMSKGCVVWKDKITSFDCTCNSKNVTIQNAQFSKHLNIYSGFCKLKYNSQKYFSSSYTFQLVNFYALAPTQKPKLLPESSQQKPLAPQFQALYLLVKLLASANLMSQQRIVKK